MLFRVQKDKENPYVMLNKSFLSDVKLSAKSKGILAYLMCLPDDWKIYLDEVSKHFKDGVKSITSGVNELIENGYISRNTLRDSKGRFKGYMYDVYEISSKTPKTENGETENGKSENGKGHTTNKLLKLNNNILSNNNNSKCSTKEKDVVVDSQIQTIVDGFSSKYKADLDPKRATTLIKLKGIDHVQECITTYGDYLQGRTVNNIGGDFYTFVSKGYTKPVAQVKTSQFNFEQREYSEEELESCYTNVND